MEHSFKIYDNNAEDLWFAHDCYATSVISLDELKEWIYLIIDKTDEIPNYIFDMLDVKNREDFRSLKFHKMVRTTFNHNAIYAIGYLRFSDFIGYNCSKKKALKALSINPEVAQKFLVNFPSIKIEELNEYSQPISLQQKIELLQAKYQITLPNDYLGFLQKTDDSLDEYCFDVWFEDRFEYEDRDIYFLKFGSKSYNIEEQPSFEFMPENLFIIGMSSGDDLIALDFSDNQTNEPRVVFVQHDDCLQKDDKLPKRFVASSFKQFIEKLYSDDTKFNDDGSLKATNVFFNKIEIASHIGTLSNETLTKASSHFETQLPSLYLDFISKYNEANLIHSMVSFKDFYSKERQESCAFLGFIHSKRNMLHPYALSVSNADKYGYKGLVAFAKSASNDLWCFDYRSDLSKPKIVYVDMDMFETDDNQQKRFVVSEVTDSFQSFLDLIGKQ